MLTPKAKMGAIGRQVRFGRNFYDNGMPGVGSYKLNHLTSFSKANQSSFDQRLVNSLHMMSRSRARHRIQTVNSPPPLSPKSPDIVSTQSPHNKMQFSPLSSKLNGTIDERFFKKPKMVTKLGGPMIPSTNKICSTSRAQRSLVFDEKIVRDFQGRNVPGPG